MNNPRLASTTNVVSAVTELVRGQDQRFLEELKPLVASQSVCLDLSSVERIDAAGVAALITLYCAAHEAGHRFTASNPAPHVEEILVVVGLDKILLSRNAAGFSGFGTPAEAAAA